MATRLGRQAAALGMETLDVARIHEDVLSTLESSVRRSGIRKQAADFFTEAIAPIERTHRAALKANRHVAQLAAALDRRTSGLVASKQSLKRRIAQRKSSEDALKRSGEHYANLLEESHRLQKHLRHLTHRIISAQEHERKKVSRELQDEIAQTLLGIHVRLLTLRTGASANAGRLKNEVASTQRLVGESAKIMDRYTHGMGTDHEP